VGGRTVRPSMTLSTSNIYILKCGGPPADGGHPGGRQTGGRADTPAGGGQGGATLRMGIHACGSRGDVCIKKTMGVVIEMCVIYSSWGGRNQIALQTSWFL
jgi:hypothetical protein